jgi:hypothetical protein
MQNSVSKMTPQLLQTAQWMAVNARPVRYQPTTGIPSAERFSQVERLINTTWKVIEDLGFNPGPKPMGIYSGAYPSFPPILLASLTDFLVEVHATYHMVGLGLAQNRAVMEFTQRKPLSAFPDYRIILDETFAEQEESEDAIFRS